MHGKYGGLLQEEIDATSISLILFCALSHDTNQNPDLRFRPLLRLVTDMPESTIAVIAGMILGFILSEGFSIRAHFSEEVFFYFILPPIIFYQGYVVDIEAKDE